MPRRSRWIEQHGGAGAELLRERAQALGHPVEEEQATPRDPVIGSEVQSGEQDVGVARERPVLPVRCVDDTGELGPIPGLNVIEVEIRTISMELLIDQGVRASDEAAHRAAGTSFVETALCGRVQLPHERLLGRVVPLAPGDPRAVGRRGERVAASSDHLLGGEARRRRLRWLRSSGGGRERRRRSRRLRSLASSGMGCASSSRDLLVLRA